MSELNAHVDVPLDRGAPAAARLHGEMQGQVTVCGLDTRSHSPGDLAGQVGLVLQNPANQLSGMRYTVYEEVAFGLENLGIPRAEMPERIEQAL